MRFFISDTHFHHENIIAHCNRPFKDVNEMDAFMIDRWNAMVDKDDEVWHLGDVCLNSKDCEDILPLLNGKKFLILGNHDGKMDAMLKAGFEKVYQQWKMRIGSKTVHMLHRPKALKGYDQGQWLLHGHMHDKAPKVDRDSKRVNLSVEHWGYGPVPESALLRILTTH
jgi:calcineurin-like phosphoesterase family protein